MTLVIIQGKREMDLLVLSPSVTTLAHHANCTTDFIPPHNCGRSMDVFQKDC
jgi:hypothetical protein